MTTTHPPTTEAVVCPVWCDDHETIRGCDGSLPNLGEVIRETHRSKPSTRGPLSASIQGCIDAEPLSRPWPRTFIEASGTYGLIDKSVLVSIGGLTLEEVRWLTSQLVNAAEMLDAETQA